MTEDARTIGFLRDLDWNDLIAVLAIIIGGRLLVLAARWAINRAAESGPTRLRLAILRWAPKARLVIEIGTIALIMPLLVEPSFRNAVALIASIGLGLAFALKDYGSCLIAGLVTIMEGTYQPGDWIEVDGTYGEVKAIGVRAVHIVTVDDTEVIVPHSRLWSKSISNATSGSRSLLCVAQFHLNADHDAAAVRRRLIEVAQSSPYLKPETAVKATVSEKPWGTLYRVKAYVKESRDQFQLTTDVTIRGKEALRTMHIKFAQVPFAETRKP
ncbi:MAG TPA: mechanosensitive ion channel domain-containing protein [Stellaceae bacterium]|nr:mechanosensitive ion channel domain-containing protein [Stellaceae bacterium]